MGSRIKSQCSNCNFNNEFNFGGSKRGFHINNSIPAINIETGNFESLNYYSMKDNPNYILYTSSVLKQDNVCKITFKNFDLELNKLNNYCPSCKNHTLDFEIIGFFD